MDIEPFYHAGHTELELRVERLADRQRHFAFEWPEPFALHFQPVAPDWQVHEAKTPLRVTLYGQALILVKIGCNDCRASDCRAVCVFDAPAERGGSYGLLRANRRAQAVEQGE